MKTTILNPENHDKNAFVIYLNSGAFCTDRYVIFLEHWECHLEAALEQACEHYKNKYPHGLQVCTFEQQCDFYSKEELAEIEKAGQGFPDTTPVGDNLFCGEWSFCELSELPDDERKQIEKDARALELAEYDPEVQALAICECFKGSEAQEFINDETWLSLTEEEADERACEYIKESLWAFNADFLSYQTGLPAEMFSAVQDQCEDANDAVYLTVKQTCGLDEFCDAAISADGRGHFISSYDGEEREQEIEGETFYVYRLN